MPKKDQTTTYECDIRYHGQGLSLTVPFEIEQLEKEGLDLLGQQFDAMHEQLFTFALDADKEVVNVRAVAQGRPTKVRAQSVAKGGQSPAAARITEVEVFIDGKDRKAGLYDRGRLKAGNVIDGPAIVQEMDSTTLILPGHEGTVDDYGNILINPA